MTPVPIKSSRCGPQSGVGPGSPGQAMGGHNGGHGGHHNWPPNAPNLCSSVKPPGRPGQRCSEPKWLFSGAGASERYPSLPGRLAGRGGGGRIAKILDQSSQAQSERLKKRVQLSKEVIQKVLSDKLKDQPEEILRIQTGLELESLDADIKTLTDLNPQDGGIAASLDFLRRFFVLTMDSLVCLYATVPDLKDKLGRVRQNGCGGSHLAFSLPGA